MFTLLAVIIVGGLALFYFNKAGNTMDFNKKIIILGFDGLSPEIIEPMMEKGELPNFSKLKEKGSYRHLATTNPSQSPVAWAGFATGKNPGKTQVFDFLVRDPKTYLPDISISRMENGKPVRVVKAKSFWQYTSEGKIPNVILGCPVTFPPDKVYGRMLSGMGVPDILGTEGTFTFYTTEDITGDKDYGGKVFQVERADEINVNLIGPRVKTVRGKADNVSVPVTVIPQEKEGVLIRYQNQEFGLKTGEWSGWKEVVFDLGLFKSMRGIVKFYLVESQPHLKLYISPINFDPRQPAFPISYPAGYSKELAEKIGLYYTQGMPMHTWAVNEKRLTEEPFLHQIEEVLSEKRAMLEYELNRFKKGVFFVYFESPDIIQHMFWRYTDPEHPLYEADAPEKYKNMIYNWYQRMDSILGFVMDSIGDEDILIVLSDHGFDTFRRAVHVNSWLRENGYLVLKNTAVESGQPLLRGIDWSRTKAYALGFGAIYINQRGRESKGIVSPGKETETLKEEITGKLEKWKDDKSGQLVINNVYPRQEIFWGKYAPQTPDLYIGFNTGYRASWQTALGDVPAKLIEDNEKKWSGTHLIDPELIPGIIFSNQKINTQNPSIYDIAPTVLQVAGFSEEELQDCEFDGNTLFD